MISWSGPLVGTCVTGKWPLSYVGLNVTSEQTHPMNQALSSVLSVLSVNALTPSLLCEYQAINNSAHPSGDKGEKKTRDGFATLLSNMCNIKIKLRTVRITTVYPGKTKTDQTFREQEFQ